MLSGLGNYESAVSLARRSYDTLVAAGLRETVEAASLIASIGRTCFARRDHKGARRAFTSAIEIQSIAEGLETSQGANLKALLATSLLRCGDCEGAASRFEEARAYYENTCGNTTADRRCALHMQAHQVHLKVLQRRYDEALALYEALPAHATSFCPLSEPGPCGVEYTVAYAKARRGNLVESQAHFDAARKIFEDTGTRCTVPFAELLVLEAFVLAERGSYDKALSNCECARKLYMSSNDLNFSNPDVAGAYMMEAYVKLKQGNHAEALKCYKYARSIPSTALVLRLDFVDELKKLSMEVNQDSMPAKPLSASKGVSEKGGRLADKRWATRRKWKSTGRSAAKDRVR